MGIQGLLPFLKNASRPAHIKDFKGCTVAIDSYCWLHKGAFACAEKLAMNEPTDQYVVYCLKYVNNLLKYGIKPVMVFDGCHLPSKKLVEKQRRERREMYRKKAKQLLRDGMRSEARDALTKCVDITPNMALELMQACREKGVDCIVAPYEADAQLAYLSLSGIAQVIITEDSDLVLFGCERMMFKMDIAGHGMLVEKTELPKALDLKADLYSFDKLRYMCILSGCDYLASIPGIGLKKAQKLFQITRQTDLRILIRKLPSTLNMNVVVPPDYIENYIKANNTFLYQLVFDPLTRRIRPLHDYPDDIDPDQLHYAGPKMDHKKALHIALGNLNVNTGEKMADFNPDNFKPKSTNWDDTEQSRKPHLRSIWDPLYRPRGKGMHVVTESGDHSNTQSRSHGNTLGKEVKVNVKLEGFRRKSLGAKRPREEEENVPSEKELASLYGGGDAGADVVKKAKVEDIFSDNLQSGNYDDVYHDNPENAAGEGSRDNQPSDQELSMQDEPLKENSPPKRSPLKSPLKSPNGRRNVFAALAAKRKERVDINKPKTEVKSRYFGASDQPAQPLKKTAFCDKLEKEYLKPSKPRAISLVIKQESQDPSASEQSDDQSDDHSDTEEQNSPRENKSDAQGEKRENQLSEQRINDDNFESSENSGCHGNLKPSPYQSFGRNKLHLFKSDFDKSCVSTSNGSKSQFKPVKSVTRVTSNASLATNDSDSMMTQESCASGVSGRSNLYSIDSESFSQSIDTEQSKATQGSDTDASQSSASRSVSSFWSSSKTEQKNEISTPLSSSQPAVTPSNCRTMGLSRSASSSAVSSGGKRLSGGGGCRNSGLSKSSRGRGKAAKTNSSDNQKSITNFFAQFRRDQNMPTSSRKPLSPVKLNQQ